MWGAKVGMEYMGLSHDRDRLVFDRDRLDFDREQADREADRSWKGENTFDQ